MPHTLAFARLPHIENSPKRIRILYSGQFIVDTKQAKLIWEHSKYPYYYFAHSDLSSRCIGPGRPSEDTHATIHDLVSESRSEKDAVTKFNDTATDGRAGLLKITFDAADAFFEEDEQIFVHPKDPYKRCDVLQSSSKIRIEYEGVVLAESTRPKFLFETSLRRRTYIPKTDCRLDYLRESTTTSQCPYKGIANYCHANLPDGRSVNDIAWWYRCPLEGVGPITNLLAFFDEKVDVYVDGVKEDKAG